MKEVIKRLFQLFWKHILGAFLFFVTGAWYYLLFRYGINSFTPPIIGVIGAIVLLGLCILFILFFVKKPKQNNTPFGK